MSADLKIEYDPEEELPDPDASAFANRKIVTQPYDLVVKSLNDQIDTAIINLQPSFQREYVWPRATASRLIESILLNVPIPPCFLSQNNAYELDVVDGQQRLTAIYKFTKNEYPLSNLQICKELNGQRFHQLDAKLQRKLETHTIRCVVVTNESDDDIKFDVFERLNTNTMPLNAQELRNCIFRGPLNSLVKTLASDEKWLSILGRKSPDRRMRGAELILRFFAFTTLGLNNYRTPLKLFLNDAAKLGQAYSDRKIKSLQIVWTNTIDTCLVWFPPDECFRKEGTKAINRGIYDLICHTASSIPPDHATSCRADFRRRFHELLNDDDYNDVVSRSVDHRKRTIKRFEIWNEKMAGLLD